MDENGVNKKEFCGEKNVWIASTKTGWYIPKNNMAEVWHSSYRQSVSHVIQFNALTLTLSLY
ncbi:MAG: hypothetical protein ACRCUL_07810, partial [Plesiomonas sp.]